MNLSLAQIYNCIVFSQSGIYTLDKLSIRENEFKDIKIDISDTPTLIAEEVKKDDPDFNAYVLNGSIKYIENNESKEIGINYCTVFKFIDKFDKVQTKVYLYPNIEKKDDYLFISIESSNIVNFEPTVLALDDSYNGELIRDPMLEVFKMQYEPSVTSTGSSDDYSIKQDSHGKKRERILEYQGEHRPKHQKISIIDCGILKPGRYKFNDQENFYIEIFSLKENPNKTTYVVKGFLRYDNFFAVPIYRCMSDDKNLIFFLSRIHSEYIVDHASFKKLMPIPYKIPKNEFINEKHIDKESSHYLDYRSIETNVGCSILYTSFIKGKSTFLLKNKVIISINTSGVFQSQLSRKILFNMSGTIILDGESYNFSSCRRNFDNDNDSEIFYFKNNDGKIKLGGHYRFNILDFLPPITP